MAQRKLRAWFNLRHRRSGHLLQGRFGGFLVEDDAGWQEVARYVHLNPVRVGLQAEPKRSTLSYANAHRPWELFERLFYDLLAQCQIISPQKKFHFKNRLLSLDSTIIELCASMFDWAHWRHTKLEVVGQEHQLLLLVFQPHDHATQVRQPSLQYIVNPGGNKSISNALALGINVVFKF